MKTFDAFGNPVWVTVSAGLLATEADLYSDGEYDPTLTGYYLRVGQHRDNIGRFTNFDIHEGEILDPASLQKFRYAGQTAIHAADPGETFTPAEKPTCQGA